MQDKFDKTPPRRQNSDFWTPKAKRTPKKRTSGNENSVTHSDIPCSPLSERNLTSNIPPSASCADAALLPLFSSSSENNPVEKIEPKIVHLTPGKCFSKNLLDIKEYIANNDRKISSTLLFTIYPIAELSLLIQEKIANKEHTDLRFIVTDDGLWFGRETHGNKGKKIPAAPAHYQMTGLSQSDARCFTAGTMVLSPDQRTLERINHKSGDFSPGFDSLKWLLAILILNEGKLPFALPKTLLIDELHASGGFKRTIALEVSALRVWVEKVFVQPELVAFLKSQPPKSKVFKYESDVVRARSQPCFFPIAPSPATPNQVFSFPILPCEPENQESSFPSLPFGN